MFIKENGENVQVKSIGGRSVIITFLDEKERDCVINERWTKNWFDDLNPWKGVAA